MTSAEDSPDDYRLRQLKQSSGGLFSELEFLEVETKDTATLERGVLFLMAFWSGPAVVGLGNLCRVLGNAGLPPGFVFRVLDIDGASKALLERLSKFPIRIGGNGEAYWFCGGEIFAMTSVATASDAKILELLKDAAAGPGA